MPPAAITKAAYPVRGGRSPDWEITSRLPMRKRYLCGGAKKIHCNGGKEYECGRSGRSADHNFRVVRTPFGLVSGWKLATADMRT
jgi:hypothetical protein